MRKFLDLTYYKKDIKDFPPVLYPIKYKKINYSKGDIYDERIKLAESKYGKTLFNLFTKQQDYNILLDYATKHGIFLEKYFRRELSIRVKAKIFEEKIDLKKYYPLYCTQYNFGAYEKVEKYLPENFALDFFKVSLYNLNDGKIYSVIKEWYSKHFPLKTCEVCGKKFHLTSFPDWVYYGVDGHKSVCLECPINTNPSKSMLLKLIPKIVDECGFIPNSNFSPINHNFSSRVKDNNWARTCDIAFKMGITGSEFKHFFGSWFKALVEADVHEDGILKTARGVRCIAKSGNECNSLDEQYIDNWLFDMGFETTKEPIYPKHEKYNASGRRRADWLVNNYYIEYFGLAGDDKYDKKTLEKINLVRELDLKFIALFPEDLNSLDIKLKKLKE